VKQAVRARPYRHFRISNIGPLSPLIHINSCFLQLISSFPLNIGAVQEKLESHGPDWTASSIEHSPSKIGSENNACVRRTAGFRQRKVQMPEMHFFQKDWSSSSKLGKTRVTGFPKCIFSACWFLSIVLRVNFTSWALPTPWASFSSFVSWALPTPYFGSYRRMAKLIDSLARPDRRPGALPSLEGFQMIPHLMSRPIPRYPVCYWIWNILLEWANILLCLAVWCGWFQWFRKIPSTHIGTNWMCWGRHMREMLGLQIDSSSCEQDNTRANGTLPEE